MRKTNKILVSAAVCGILSVTLGTGVSAEYLPSFVTTTTTATVTEDITDEITDTDIPADSIIDIVEETTISTEIFSETTIPVTDLVTGDESISGNVLIYLRSYAIIIAVQNEGADTNAESKLTYPRPLQTDKVYEQGRNGENDQQYL